MDATTCSIRELTAMLAAGEVFDAAVVIDVLRAFTVAPHVLDGGAERLNLAPTDPDALALKAALGPSALAISDVFTDPGFDLPNSPQAVTSHDLVGRPVVQRTTNGTVGVHAARQVPLVLCAALVTASATAAAVTASGARRVAYVVTGEDGNADEDLVCAELIRALVEGTPPPRPADVVDRVRTSRAADRLRAVIAAGKLGVSDQDIEMCTQIDRFDFSVVAQEHDGVITATARR